MELLETTTAVIDALGGTSATARILGCGMQRVSNWRHVANFPSDTYPVITRALAERGFQAASHLWRTIPASVLDGDGSMVPPTAAITLATVSTGSAQ